MTRLLTAARGGPTPNGQGWNQASTALFCTRQEYLVTLSSESTRLRDSIESRLTGVYSRPSAWRLLGAVSKNSRSSRSDPHLSLAVLARCLKRMNSSSGRFSTQPDAE